MPEIIVHAVTGRSTEAKQALMRDITDAVVTEINALVPSVSITPPAGWQPGRQGQAAAPAAAPANPAQAPKSR